MTATSKDGLTTATGTTYTVVARPSVSIATARTSVVDGRAKITLTCTSRTPGSACRGALSLTIRQRIVRTVHHRSVSFKTITLAHVAYTIAGGHSQSVTLRLSRTGQRHLANAPHRRLSVRASVTLTGGRAAQRTIILTLGSHTRR